MAKVKAAEPKWLLELKDAADEAMWHVRGSPEDVHFRNLLKRHKSFGNIAGWLIRTEPAGYDEYGLPYGLDSQISSIKFWKGAGKTKKEWAFG